MNKGGTTIAIAALVLALIIGLITVLPQVTPQNQSGTVGTELEIGATTVPPTLLSDIPDQTWAVNTNNTNAFDLQTYFLDNETMTFSSSSAQNITIVINETIVEVFNETTNMTENVSQAWVSFYPDDNFVGTRTVVFTATDIYNLSTNSNSVLLNVTGDVIPPTWSNPAIDKAEVFQNVVVTFTTLWQDNIGLDNYELQINEGGGWVSQGVGSFSGTQATASDSVQISAPAGTTVFWRFYGNDTSQNQNVTDIQNFTVSASDSSDGGGSSGGGGGGGGGSGGSGGQGTTGNVIQDQQDQQSVTDFTVDPAEAFLIEMKQGATNTITFKVTNTGNNNLTFTIDVTGLELFTILINEPQFTLEPGDSKTVIIEITAGRFLSPDMYFGEVNIATDTNTQTVPLAIELRPFETDVDVNVTIDEDYKNVKPGEQVLANITLTNLADIEARNLTLYYAITDFRGNTIDVMEENFIFNERSTTLVRNLTTTENTEKGEYIFFARAVFGNNVSLSSDLFEVGERFSLAAFIRANLIILLILLFAFAGIVLAVRYQANKARLKLLNLYLMVSELKGFLEEGKTEQAIALYVRIKRTYGEPVSATAIHNKEKLKEEMKKISDKLEGLMIEHNIDKKDVEGMAKEKKEGDAKEGDKKEKKESGEDKATDGEAKESKEEKPAEKEPEEKPAEKKEEEPKEKEEPVKEAKEEKAEEKPVADAEKKEAPKEEKTEEKPPAKEEVKEKPAEKAPPKKEATVAKSVVAKKAVAPQKTEKPPAKAPAKPVVKKEVAKEASKKPVVEKKPAEKPKEPVKKEGESKQQPKK